MLRWIASLIGLLALSAPATLAAEPRRDTKPGASPQATHLMSLALVVAGGEGSGVGQQPLSAAVAGAIEDIQDFLPYKRYEVHDTVVVRTSALTPSRVDLQGPDGRYHARLQYQLTDDARRLNVFQFELARAPEALAPRATPAERGAPADGPQPTPQPSPSRLVISTAFAVNVGETIVVGTSRLNGSGKALVLVLSVLPSP